MTTTKAVWAFCQTPGMKPMLATVAALFVLSGCSGAEPTAAPAMTQTETETVTETEAAPTETETETVTETASPTSKAAKTTTAKDLTDQLRALADGKPWATKVTKVKRTGAKSAEVATTIVDPRGDAGSPAGTEAVQVCQATMDMLQGDGIDSPTVRVLESDGTTFAHGGIDSPECVEY